MTRSTAVGMPMTGPYAGFDGEAERGRQSRLGYFAFLLLNALLFLRPAELFPVLQEKPGAYAYMIYVCLAISLPRLLSQLSLESLLSRPMTLCVVGLQGMVVISGMLNLGPGAAYDSGSEFSKCLIYYLLLVGVVDTPMRLRGFVYFLGGLIFAATVLALLQYHGVISNPALAPVAETQAEDADAMAGGESATLIRLCGAGLYNNPNDLSRILVIGILICLYGWCDRASPILRLAWLGPLLVFGYALTLTYSRGGFLGLLVSVTVFLVVRFGGRKSLGLAVIVLPLLFVFFGGRQTDISTSSGTGRSRIEIWSDGFQLWRESPVFGIGMNNFAEHLRIVAHNSFVHAYTELGLVGGTFFLGAFYCAAMLPFRAGRGGSRLPEGELRRFRPYLIGIIAGYMMGMTSSSRNYIAPTYMLVGLSAAFMRLARPYIPHGIASLNGRLVREICVVSILTIVALHLFIRASVGGS